MVSVAAISKVNMVKIPLNKGFIEFKILERNVIRNV